MFANSGAIAYLALVCATLWLALSIQISDGGKSFGEQTYPWWLLQPQDGRWPPGRARKPSAHQH